MVVKVIFSMYQIIMKRQSIPLRVTDIDYTFSGANFSGTATFDYNYAGENQTRQNCALYSYTTFGNVNTNITPEVINLPSWCTVSLINESTLYFVYKIGVSQNNSSERSGYITFKQPESNKTVSVKVVQYDHYNRIAISVKELYSNHPVFTATTTYPVKKDISCRIPYEAYNDGESMTAMHQSLFRKEKRKELTKWIIMVLRQLIIMVI